MLSLEIETSRQKQVDAKYRCCPICHTEVEDEYHFMFRYSLYLPITNIFGNTLKINDFDLLSVLDKQTTLMHAETIVRTDKYMWYILEV